MLYVICMFIYLKAKYEAYNVQLSCHIFIDYITASLFWYNIAFFVVTAIPLIILFFFGTLYAVYPAIKDFPSGNSMFGMLPTNAMYISNIGTTLAIAVFPVLYLFDCYNLGAITTTELALSTIYPFALIRSSSIWLHLIKRSYYAIFDTITIWKSMFCQLRQDQSIQV
jgi:hypothetical protein